MDPNITQQPAQNLTQQPQQQAPQPQAPIQNSSSNRKKYGIIFLALFILILIPLVAFGSYYVINSNSEVEKTASSANPFMLSGDQANSSQSSNSAKGDFSNDLEFKLLPSNKKINISNNDAYIYCGPPKTGEGDNRIEIWYGEVDKVKYGGWIFVINEKDIEFNKTYKLPPIQNRDPLGPYLALGYNQQSYGTSVESTTGTIKINKFGGCELGQDIAFEISANIPNEDDGEGSIQAEGEFSGKFNKNVHYLNQKLPFFNNSRRKEHLQQLHNGLVGYIGKGGWSSSSGVTSTPRYISKSDLDICAELIEYMVNSLPADPLKSDGEKVTDCNSNYDTGYLVSSPEKYKLIISAPLAELGEVIQYSI